MENVSLFRVEESEAEKELRAMLGLGSPEDPEPTILPSRISSKEPENPVQAVESTPPSRLVHGRTPILNPSEPLAQSSNDMQVDQTNIPPVTAPPQNRTRIVDDPPASNPTPSTNKLSGRPPPVSEPPQPSSSWDPISFVSDEEEEEIPSINMDSDSD